MKLAALAVLLAATTASADVSILDNHKAVTVDCAKDKEVSLIGNHLTVTLTGTCTKITVTGNHEVVTGAATAFFVAGNYNALTVSAADDISIAGNNNIVSWDKKAAKAPKVKDSGKDNQVTSR